MARLTVASVSRGLGPGCGVVFWGEQAALFELGGHPGEDVAVFGVDQLE